jgi:DNA-binding GntR family transcriptional regulator
MVIDREWDEPVYQQVAGILRDQIKSGKIEPRRPIPSIRTLCETYGVARATAGKAIRLLADEGLIRRVPGKGWFVAPQSDGPASRLRAGAQLGRVDVRLQRMTAASAPSGSSAW